MATSGKQSQAVKLLRKSNVALLIAGAFSIGSWPYLGGLLLPLTLTTVIVLVVVTIQSRRYQLNTSPYTRSLLISLCLVMALALAGFYGNHTHAVPYDTGATWVSSKSIGAAAAYTFLTPATFIGALLGYDCNLAYGENCSATPLFLGVALTCAIFGLGAYFGTSSTRH